MRTISLLEFRKSAKKVLMRAQQGERMIMTFRGKPVCRIEPIGKAVPQVDDPFYQIDDLSQAKGRSLSNKDIDKIVYGL